MADLIRNLPAWAPIVMGMVMLYGSVTLGMAFAGLARSFTLPTLVAHAHDLLVGVFAAGIPLVAALIGLSLPLKLAFLGAFVICVGVPLLAFDTIMEALHSKSTTHIASGGVFIVIGLVWADFFLRRGAGLMDDGPIFGYSYLVVGLISFGRGLWMNFHPNSKLAQKEEAGANDL